MDSITVTYTKTAMQLAAQTAIDCQDACNLSGVLASFKEIVHEVIWPEARKLGKGTEYVNRHPIVTLFIYKLACLNSAYMECDYLHASDACEAIARGESSEYMHEVSR
jgi:hypothetical protein